MNPLIDHSSLPTTCLLKFLPLPSPQVNEMLTRGPHILVRKANAPPSGRHVRSPSRPYGPKSFQ